MYSVKQDISFYVAQIVPICNFMTLFDRNIQWLNLIELYKIKY